MTNPITQHKLLFIASIFLVIGLYATTAHQVHWWPFQSNNPSQNTSEKTVNESPKNSNKPSKSDIKATPGQTQTTDDVPVSQGASMTISQLSEANNTVSVSAVVQNPPSGTGSCVVTFSNPNDRPITKQFDPASKENVVSCATQVPAYEFSFLGDWNVSVVYYAGDQKVSTEGTVHIK